jgi:hypothetical protein
MVKNIPTIERSTKIRFGKYATDDQAENTIVFNASNTAIDASTAGTMYMSPLRIAELAGATFIGYSSSTKEVVDTGVATSLLGGVTLDSAALQGNVVSNSIPHFANVTTAFTTGHGSNVGISNTAPTHMLSVGDKIFMSNTGEEAIKVEGNVRAQRFFVGQSISLDSSSTNNIQVSGKIKTSSIETTDHIAVSNNQNITKLVSVGSHTFINTPSVSESAITTSGNVTAAFYKGDAGLLSNVIHTGTLPISKGGTGQTTAVAAASALGLGTEDSPSFVTVNANVIGNNVDVITLNGNVIGNNVDVITLNGNVVGNNVDVITLNGNVVGNNVDVITLNGNVIGNNVSVITLSGNVIGNNVDVITLSGNVIGNNVDVITLYGNVIGNNVDVITLTGNVIGNNVDVITLNGNVVGNNVDVITLYGNVIGNNVDVITLNGNVIADNVCATNNIETTSGFFKGNGGILSNVTLQQVTDTSNSTTNTIASTNTTTGFVSSGNVHVGSNIQVSGLTSGFVPIVGSDKFLRNSVIEYSGDTTTISSNVEITGNLLVLGNTFTIESNSLVINDRVLGIANNNVSHSLDVGIIMGHPGHNIAFIHHGEPVEGDPHEHEMVLGYTQNTVSDNHILDDANIITFRVLGNVIVQNNLTITSGDLTAITVNSNVVGDNVNVITLNGNVIGNNVDVITLNGNVVGNNVDVITLNGNVIGNNVDVITLYGNVIGNNVDVITLSGNVIGNNVDVITLYGNVIGNNVDVITLNGNVNAGNVVTTTIELGHASDTTLARSGAGVVTIAGSEVRTGTVAITHGGTGQTTAVAAASALGLGTEDSPSFVTVNANVNAGNVTSGSIKLTDPGIVGTFSTDTITINAENRTYGTAPLVVATGDIDSLVLINLIDGAQVVVPILASGGDRVISKDLTNVNFTVITEDVSITQDKHGLMTLSNIAGNVYMNTVAFS